MVNDNRPLVKQSKRMFCFSAGLLRVCEFLYLLRLPLPSGSAVDAVAVNWQRRWNG